MKFCRPYSGKVVLGLLGLSVGSGVNLLFPEVIRRYLASGTSTELALHLGPVVSLLAALFLVQGVSFYVRSFFFNRVGLHVVSDVRRAFFASVLQKDVSFLDEHRAGELVSQLNSDVSLIQELVSVRFSVIIRYSVQVLFGTVLMAWMSWRLTLALVASVVVMIGVSALFLKRLRKASHQYQGALATLTSFASECFQNVRLIKVSGAVGWVSELFTEQNTTADTSVLRSGMHRGMVSASFTSGASVLLNLLLLAVFWYGASLVMQGDIALSDFSAFALYGAIVAVSFSFLISSYAEVVQAVGGLDRVFFLLEAVTPPAGQKIENQENIVRIDSVDEAAFAVEMEGVEFSYASSPQESMIHISEMQVPLRGCTAVVGPSGSGKSTLIALLLGLYTPQRGTIRLFGRAVTSFTPEEIAIHLAWAPQEGALFGLSILDNVRLGNNAVSRQQIMAAFERWTFMGFISELPRGIDTVIGEDGVQLSGGQKQRIAIARAILRRPKLLLLDEATSGLDSDTEQDVLRTLQKELPNASVLVVSHRLATIKMAETIYVLEAGRVVQKGTHETLKMASGLYQRYIEQQTLA